MPGFQERIPSLCPSCGQSVDTLNHEGFCSEDCFFKVYPHGLGEKIDKGGMSIQNEVALELFEKDVKDLERDSGFTWAVLKERFGTDNVVAVRARWEALNEKKVVDIQSRGSKVALKPKRKSVPDDYRKAA